jgi:hypothetical protein
MRFDLTRRVRPALTASLAAGLVAVAVAVIGVLATQSTSCPGRSIRS